MVRRAFLCCLLACAVAACGRPPPEPSAAERAAEIIKQRYGPQAELHHAIEKQVGSGTVVCGYFSEGGGVLDRVFAVTDSGDLVVPLGDRVSTDVLDRLCSPELIVDVPRHH